MKFICQNPDFTKMTKQQREELNQQMKQRKKSHMFKWLALLIFIYTCFDIGYLI